MHFEQFEIAGSKDNAILDQNSYVDTKVPRPISSSLAAVCGSTVWALKRIRPSQVLPLPHVWILEPGIFANLDTPDGTFTTRSC